ncbi:MAG: ATP-binding protein [Candidatus Aenigmatarchaeota archaeon]
MEEIALLKEKIKKLEEELKLQAWGLAKSNEAIKSLYKELEKKNKELQKLDELKSEFLNTVSHELRTPLTTIREVISQFLDGILGEINPKQREFLLICLEDVDRLKRIIDNLLDISKLEAKRVKLLRENIDIVNLAKTVIANFSAKAVSKNLKLIGNFPKEAIAYIDRDKIMQVFTNLVGNAIKFTKEGYIEIKVIDRDNFVECSVIDTGIGIAKDNLSKVFDKFQQFGKVVGGSEKGTGLGLSISKGIIDLHGGKIWVESTLGKGTKFTFTIPKYNEKEIYREHITKALEEAIVNKTFFSVIIICDKNYKEKIERLGLEQFNSILKNFSNLINQLIRKSTDNVFIFNQKIFITLFDADKNVASNFMQRIRNSLINYIYKELKSEVFDISFEIISYPEDKPTKEEFLDRLKILVD